MANAPRTKKAKAKGTLRATSKNIIHPYFIARPEEDAAKASWTVTELCKAYEWPGGLEGGGVIALIHCSGERNPADVDRYFADAGLPVPNVTEHPVDGTTDKEDFQIPVNADTEVALGIQIAGAAYAIATGKAATIRIYWSKDLVAGLRAASDGECDVCCITWGADENSWDEADAYAFDEAAQAATDKDMIIVAASGDNDLSDGGSTAASVDFPASSPHVISCGGTTKTDAESRAKVWNDQPGQTDGNGTGGGFSKLFKIPKWQLGTVQAEMRIVPDVAAHADPNNGYRIFVGGGHRVVGGTSAAAALYAGLFAAFGPKRGFILPDLYQNQVCSTDITQGDNGKYRALVGPDPCTGLGSPKGKFLATRVGGLDATLKRLRSRLKAANSEILQLRASAPPCPCQSASYPSALPILAPPGLTDLPVTVLSPNIGKGLLLRELGFANKITK